MQFFRGAIFQTGGALWHQRVDSFLIFISGENTLGPSHNVLEALVQDTEKGQEILYLQCSGRDLTGEVGFVLWALNDVNGRCRK